MIRVVKAGKRFGKSELAIFMTIKAAGEKPNGTFWYIAPYMSHAEGIAWDRFKDLIPSQFIRRITQQPKLMIELVNGSKIFLKGADNQVSLRGTKLDGAVFDEAAYMDKYIWNNIIRGQLLGVGGERPGFAFFISSPLNPIQAAGKVLKDWYPEFFAEAQRKQMTGDADWAAFHYTIYDNPLLTREYIEKMKEDSTDDEWNTEYMAKESSFTGQVVSEFKFDLHVKEYEMDRSFELSRALDWGIQHPTACLWINYSHTKKIVYVNEEFQRSDLRIKESCGVIKQMTGDKKVEWSVIDPSTRKRNSQTELSDSDEFTRNGVPVMLGDNNDRGYDIMKMFFKKNLILVHPKCRHLINQLKTVQYGQKVGEDLCFVAGTKVITENGNRPIESIYIGDKVLTRNGYKKVIDSGMSNGNAEVYCMRTSFGNELIGTYYHPIMTKNGEWKKLGELKSGDMLIDNRLLLLIEYGIWKLKLSLQPFRSLTEFVTTSLKNISRNVLSTAKKVSVCTETFGHIITELFLLDLSFITKTMTGRITKFQIWNVCTEVSISPIIQENQRLENERENGRQLFVRLQKNGIEARKEKNGIANTVKKFSNQEYGLRKYVKFAVEIIKLLFHLIQNFVILIADKLTLKDVKVLSVTRLDTKQSVFNLTVEDTHEYFANGLLVHNCDCLRYGLLRIHDVVFNGNINNIDQDEIRRTINPFNFNENILFKDTKKGSIRDFSWANGELEEVA